MVLGNRQLVSVFLIVVVLLGVFFSTGYFVGRNSTANPSPNIAARQTSPIVVDNPSKGNNSAGDSRPAPSSPVSSSSPPDRADLPVESKPEPKTAIIPVEKPSPLHNDTRAGQVVDGRAEPPVQPVAGPVVGTPRAGSFWQVVATTRPDAELIAETLGKKGFNTAIAPGPNATLFRVLVGPLNGKADKAEVRVRLESAGFKNPYERTY